MTVARFLTSPGGITLAEVATRPGGLDDADRVVSMHHRCSAESIYRRYHAPLPRLSLRLAERLLQPTGGWSLVAERAGRVVGLTCAGPLSGTDLEVGLLVEDAEQQRGLGARMLREVANEASQRGYQTLHCLTQPDNQRILATANRAGLVAQLAREDGLLQVRLPMRGLYTPRRDLALARGA
jgi:GNAT superfamily N-acetyltransferase